MTIYSKIKKSFEATKEAYEAWIAFGSCLAVAAFFALGGSLIWIARLIGQIWACFLFAAVFAIAATAIKLFINSREAEAARNFESAKKIVKRDVEVVTAPFRSADQIMTRAPALPLVLVGLAVLFAYLSRNHHDSHQIA